jgi:hypothetical protein
MRPRIDGFTTFIIELYVVVGGRLVITQRDVRLRRLELKIVG